MRVDAPNPRAHELISLALFALGQYGPAASEAHAAMALGTIADWKDLYAYYNDVTSTQPSYAPWKRHRPTIPRMPRTISCWVINT